jgi:hypothetical protein
MSTSDLGAIPLGERLTVRHRLPDGQLTDAVGSLTARDATSVTLRTRRGEVRVELSSVVAHRQVRPTPWRIATFLRRAGVAVLDLDRVVGDGQSAATVSLVEELRTLGIPVFDCRDLGITGPAPEAYAFAHARIEQRLERAVPVDEVHFTDDSPANVDAARAFGWQARVFTHPG